MVLVTGNNARFSRFSKKKLAHWNFAPPLEPVLLLCFESLCKKMSTVLVTVPEGSKPGSDIIVQTPHGSMKVTIPEGVAPGQQIQVADPAQVVVQAAVVTQPGAPMAQGAPPNCQPGGVFVNQSWCGPTTCIIGWLGGCFFSPIISCVACCIPCDERQVYLEPGQSIPRDPHNGMSLEDPCACCNCKR